MAAAYAALVSLSQIIQQILHPPPTHNFLIPTKQIESLQEQVCCLIDFLEKYSSQETADIEKRIVGAAHKAEDIIESYVVNHIQAEYKIYREIGGSPVCFPSIQKEISNVLPNQKVSKLKTKAIAEAIHKIASVRAEVDEIRKGKDVVDARPANSTAPSSSKSFPGGKSAMIGFDEHLNHIRIALATDESRLQIIPVVGMGGIGKTTLATHVYNDAYIVERFQFRAWVSVSLEYNLLEIVVALLQQINSNIQVNGLSADKLGVALYKELFGRDYFVVLDDMWDIEAWDMLKQFLPDNGNGSRILVTTRLLNLAVGLQSCVPYQVSLLSDDSSWALLLEHGLRNMHCPNELVEIGKRIARKCGGLPLALVVIGGLLAKVDRSRFAWVRVEENVTSTANDENDEQCMKILRLSYSQLPVYLKPCFLYLAIFPKNVEIRMSRLIKLWVAEGLIKPSTSRTLEEVAEGYVEDLCDRNLIMVEKRGVTGKLKSCSIHDLIRDLCTREACTDKFVCMPKLDNPTISSSVKRERRLSIHFGAPNQKACKVLRSATLNRSFFSYSKWDSRSCIARKLNLLRILDVVDFYCMEEILRLFNSRYICCGIPRNPHLVPSFISLLWNLQTLVVPWSVYLPSEIWNMPQLRHLKMPGIHLPDPSDGEGESGSSIIVLENLQSLSTVNNFIFREQILERIPNLKKLGIRCNTIEKGGFFCLKNLASLAKLESLVIECKGTWETMAFPSSLKKLSLSYCQIPWEDMSTVGSLPNLEVLKLETRAAKGRMWNPNADEFSRLKFLLIDECEMEIWAADDCVFPCLEHLHLVKMKMEEIPVEFAEIATLQTIHLNYCRSLVTSAKRISKERESFGYEEIQIRSFPFEGPRLKKKDVVGFQDEATKLIRDLCNHETTEEVKVISIVGMRGIGKTTLATKIFYDPKIQYRFDSRIWVNASQHFTRNDILLSILNEITNLTEEDKQSKTDTELASTVDRLLRYKSFLVVIDDVLSCEDYDSLQTAFPRRSSMGSKVLITSREAEVGWHVNAGRGPHMLRFLTTEEKQAVGWHVNAGRGPHMLRFLTTEESRLLLRREVFGKAGYSRELEDEGSVIAERCKGLPLAILHIAGILRKSFLAASEMGAKKRAWKQVSDILATYLDYDPLTRLEHIILLSYEESP